MADEEKTDGTEEGGEEKSGGGLKKIIIMAVVGLVLIGASIGGTIFFMSGGEDAAATGEGATAAAEEAEPEKLPAIYFPIKPALIVNFNNKGRRHLLQVSITIMSRDQETIAALQTHLPLVKNKLTMVIGSEAYEDLQTDEGRELLRQRVLDKLNAVMKEEINKSEVEQVLFEGFVMQ